MGPSAWGLVKPYQDGRQSLLPAPDGEPWMNRPTSANHLRTGLAYKVMESTRPEYLKDV